MARFGVLEFYVWCKKSSSNILLQVCFFSPMCRSAAESRRLIGHSGPVFSTSFNYDNKFLLSSSEDKTSNYELEHSGIVYFICCVVYNTIQYNTIQYNAIQYNTIQYDTILYNTKQYNTIR